MLTKSLPLLFFCELRVVVESEVYGSLEDDVGAQVSVGFGDDASVDGAWRMRCGCAVVFHGLSHDLYLCGCEPSLQALVGGEDLCAGDVVDGSWPAEAEVVVCGDDVDHVDVGRGMSCDGERTAYDGCYVLHVVGSIKLCVAWKDFLFHKFH